MLSRQIICPISLHQVNLKVMAEAITFTKTVDRTVLYDEIVPQIAALVEGETDLIANLANIAAVLKEVFGFFWVGFYLKKDGQLVLGPFQGPLACTRIDFDNGVCGHAFTTQETVIVPDVDKFPGHIACASASRSEIVVPMFDSGDEVFGVLDVDSDEISNFSEIDSNGLRRIVNIIEQGV
jgi:L-methionine (R)-S-oxide reductase